MKLGKISLGLRYKVLEAIVGYNRPTKLNFIEHFILNIILFYPDKNKSLKEVIQEEFNIYNLSIYDNVLKKFIEGSEMITLDPKHYTNAFMTSWMNFPIKTFLVNEDTPELFNRGLKKRQSKIRETYFNFIFNEITHQTQIEKKISGFVDEDQVKYKIEMPKEKYNCLEVTRTLDLYKTKEQKWFNEDTTFTFIKVNNETMDRDADLSSYQKNIYKLIEANVVLTKYFSLKLEIPNDKDMERKLNEIPKLEYKILLDFVNGLQEKNSKIINTSKELSSHNLNNLILPFRELEEEKKESLIYFINAKFINQDKLHDFIRAIERPAIIIVINWYSSKMAYSEHTGNKFIIYISKNFYQDKEDWYKIIFFHANNYKGFNLVNCDLIQMNKKIILGSEISGEKSNDILGTLFDKLIHSGLYFENINVKLGLTIIISFLTNNKQWTTKFLKMHLNNNYKEFNFLLIFIKMYFNSLYLFVYNIFYDTVKNLISKHKGDIESLEKLVKLICANSLFTLQEKSEFVQKLLPKQISVPVFYTLTQHLDNYIIDKIINSNIANILSSIVDTIWTKNYLSEKIPGLILGEEKNKTISYFNRFAHLYQQAVNIQVGSNKGSMPGIFKELWKVADWIFTKLNSIHRKDYAKKIYFYLSNLELSTVQHYYPEVSKNYRSYYKTGKPAERWSALYFLAVNTMRKMNDQSKTNPAKYYNYNYQIYELKSNIELELSLVKEIKQVFQKLKNVIFNFEHNVINEEVQDNQMSIIYEQIKGWL